MAPIKDSSIGIFAMLTTAILLLPALAQAITSAFNISNPSLQNAVMLFCQQTLFGLLAIWHLRVNLRLAWPDFGMRAITAIRAGRAIMVGILLVAVNGIGVWLGKGTLALFMGTEKVTALFLQEESTLMGLFRNEQSAVTLAALFLVVMVAAPLAEELFFRGYLYAVLKGRLGKHAIWISCLLFTAVHLYVVHALSVFLVALILTWLYERRGALWDNVLAHATLNGVIGIILLIQR